MLAARCIGKICRPYTHHFITGIIVTVSEAFRDRCLVSGRGLQYADLRLMRILLGRYAIELLCLSVIDTLNAAYICSHVRICGF